MQQSLVKPYVVYGCDFHHGIPLAEMDEMLFVFWLFWLFGVFHCFGFFLTVSEIIDQ